MLLTILVHAVFCSSSHSTYVLQDHYDPSNFLDSFTFFDGPDPTQGYVNYVDRSAARNAGLIQERNDTIYVGVDSHTLNPAEGRMSVRLESKASYTQGLIILDLAHMPGSIGPQWPSNGEIDIIEGVNSQDANSMALHTLSGCSIDDGGNMPSLNGIGLPPSSGTIKTRNCDVNAPGQGVNVGCVITAQDASTYGDGFNNAGGGIYATEWAAGVINVYHFSKANVPTDIASGEPDPSGWGIPLASFKGCDFSRVIKNQTIIFDTTFCGQWAGQQAVWSNDTVCSSKAATCQEYVAGNPEAFVESFWEIRSLKIYQQDVDQATPSPQTPHWGPPTSILSSSVAIPIGSSSLRHSSGFAGYYWGSPETIPRHRNHLRPFPVHEGDPNHHRAVSKEGCAPTSTTNPRGLGVECAHGPYD